MPDFPGVRGGDDDEADNADDDEDEDDEDDGADGVTVEPLGQSTGFIGIVRDVRNLGPPTLRVSSGRGDKGAPLPA